MDECMELGALTALAEAKQNEAPAFAIKVQGAGALAALADAVEGCAAG